MPVPPWPLQCCCQAGGTLLTYLGLSRPRNFLVHGPHQSGKTSLCRSFASALGAPLLLHTAGGLAQEYPGRLDLGLAECFVAAVAAALAHPSRASVLLLDGLDALLGAEESRREDSEWDALRAFSLGCSRASAAEGVRVWVCGTCTDPALVHPMALAELPERVPLGPPQARGGMLLAALRSLGAEESVLAKEGAAIEALGAASGQGFLAGDIAAVARDALTACSSSGSSNGGSLAAALQDPMAARTPLLMVLGGSAPRSAGGRPGGEAGHRLTQALAQAAGLELPLGVVDVQDFRCPFVLGAVNGGETVKSGALARAPQQPQAASRSPRSASSSPSLNSALSGLAMALRPTNPATTWEDVKGQAAAKASLQQLLRVSSSTAAAPAQHSGGAMASATAGCTPALLQQQQQQKSLPSGVLLYGPPGTGKTLLAKATASALGARFINVSIPSILRAGLGDSEAALAATFELAVCAAPSVVFMDEVQALFAARGSGGGEDGDSRRLAGNLTATLLQCLDSARGRGVTVLAATNLPSELDEALLRPGRLDRAVYVGLPSGEDRGDIFRALLGVHAVAQGVGEPLVARLVLHTERFSGADCAALFSRAVGIAVQKSGVLGSFLGQVYGAAAAEAAAEAAVEAELVLTPACFEAALFGDEASGLAAMKPSVDSVTEALVMHWKRGGGSPR